MDFVVMISDTHVGRRTLCYDVQRFRVRMRKLVMKVRKLDQVADAMYVFLLGDIVDGENVYRGQPYEQEAAVGKMIEVAYGALKDWDNFVDGIWCVPGNHGRVGRQNSAEANWDRMLYRMMQEGFEVPVHVADDWYLVANIRGWKFLLVHGDNIRMWQQIPFYGIHRMVLRWKGGGIEEDFDVVCMGHFHTAADFWVNNVRVLMNGTMLCGDGYSMRMGLRPTNVFWLIGVDSKSGVSWQKQMWVGPHA